MSFLKKLAFRTKRAAPPIGDESPEAPVPSASAPFFLMVGSLSDCSLKDGELFARGLAEKYVTTLSLGRILVRMDDVNKRVLYEIHEGGPMLSVLDGVLSALTKTEMVRVRLTDGGHVEIADVNGELFTLVYPASAGDSNDEGVDASKAVDAAKSLVALDANDLCSKTELKELFPEKRVLVKVGAALMAASTLALVLAGAGLMVAKSGVLEPDLALRQARLGHVVDVASNPVWQLEKASLVAEREGKALRFLKKDANGWSWSLESPPSATATGQPSAPNAAPTPLNPPGSSSATNVMPPPPIARPK